MRIMIRITDQSNVYTSIAYNLYICVEAVFGSPMFVSKFVVEINHNI